MAVVRLSQLFPQLGLDKDTLLDDFLEYQLQDDAEMPKDSAIEQVLGLYGAEEKSRWTNFQQFCCRNQIAPVHISLKRI